MAEPTIRILIADDHVIVRKGIRALLKTEPGMQVVGEAGDGQEAVSLAQTLKPDLILMDLVMPRMDGIEATRRITEKPEAPQILVLTSFAADDKVFPAIKAGALGYLLKDSGPDELVQAIRQVYRGEPSLEPSIARKVLMELSHPTRAELTLEPLSERELDVLRLIAQGCSNRAIADKLVISDVTVRTHVSNILSKLHLASRTQAALYALREGLASLEDVPFDAELHTITAPQEKASPADNLVEPLSERELEVLQLIAMGRTNQEIALQLIVAPGTVKAHTASIYRKLDVANRTEAVAHARQLGILP